MKKIAAYLLVIALAVTLVFSTGTTALAASIRTSVKISPSTLAGAGTVGVTVTITNNGDPISNVVLKYPSPTNTEVALDNLGTGNSAEHVNPNWAISEDMLNVPLQFMVYWTNADGTQSSGGTETFTIAKQESSVNVTGSAEANVREINKGDKVTFTFIMKNSGNVKVDTAYLNAPPIDNGAKIGKDFSLDPGSTKKMEYTVTVNESMEVKPVFTYTAGGQQYTLPLDTMSISVANAQTGAMTVAVDVDKTSVETGGKVKFNLRIDNTGSSALSGLSVTDFDGNAVTVSPTSLAPGERATGSVEIPIAQSGNYSFRVAAKDANGNNVNANSNSVAISVDGAAASAQPTDSTELGEIVMINVTIATNLPKPQEITAKFEVVNRVQEDLSNIVVSAIQGDTAKTMGTLESLAAGSSEMVEGLLNVQETGDYVFKVTAQLPDGRLGESQTDPITITVTGKAEEGMSSTMLGVIVVLIAIAAVAVILGVYISKQRKKGKAAKAAPKKPQPEQQISPNGRVRPPRYNSANGDEMDGRPESRRYQQRTQRVETIEPKPQAAPKPRPQQKPQSGPGTKYGDRNKF
ncbi:hypothetical protein LJC56_10365 [Christensenellaceae bacterium OttesenSCG-928-K19]|nr:hypothetical protein [Christensenellaceae bacterium OttesenSCG-928-K19]